MKAYAQMLERRDMQWNGERLVPCQPFHTVVCGTDGVFPLDGRWSWETMWEKASEYRQSCNALWKRRYGRKRYSGFDLHRGDLRTSTIVRTYRDDTNRPLNAWIVEMAAKSKYDAWRTACAKWEWLCDCSAEDLDISRLPKCGFCEQYDLCRKCPLCMADMSCGYDESMYKQAEREMMRIESGEQDPDERPYINAMYDLIVSLRPEDDRKG